MERRRAILLALLVTFLWSTSWVLIKLGLRHSLPPLSFAGLRYMLAFLCLVPFVAFNRAQRAQLLRLERRDWAWLAALGLVYYALTQGSQYSQPGIPARRPGQPAVEPDPGGGGFGWVVLPGRTPRPAAVAGIGADSCGVVVYFQSESLQH